MKDRPDRAGPQRNEQAVSEADCEQPCRCSLLGECLLVRFTWNWRPSLLRAFRGTPRFLALLMHFERPPLEFHFPMVLFDMDSLGNANREFYRSAAFTTAKFAELGNPQFAVRCKAGAPHRVAQLIDRYHCWRMPHDYHRLLHQDGHFPRLLGEFDLSVRGDYESLVLTEVERGPVEGSPILYPWVGGVRVNDCRPGIPRA